MENSASLDKMPDVPEDGVRFIAKHFGNNKVCWKDAAGDPRIVLGPNCSQPPQSDLKGFCVLIIFECLTLGILYEAWKHSGTFTIIYLIFSSLEALLVMLTLVKNPGLATSSRLRSEQTGHLGVYDAGDSGCA